MRLRLQAEHVVEGWLPPATPGRAEGEPAAPRGGPVPDDRPGRAVRHVHRRHRPGGAGHPRGGRQAVQLRRGPARPGRQAAAGAWTCSSRSRWPAGPGPGSSTTTCTSSRDTLRQNSSLRVKIYPLVLMPSAFAEGLGGGRAAELNAGRALLDLFRLVDQQNGADAERELRSAYDQRPVDPEEVAVTYPGNQRIVMRPGTMQTGLPVLPARGRQPRGHAPVDRLAGDVPGGDRDVGGRRPDRASTTSRSRTASSTRRRTGRWPPRTGSATAACRRRWSPR